jgi:heme exporter protein A
MTLTLAADNLACVRGGHPVFANLSFGATAGTLLAVEGPNGSGKTSLLRLIAGFIDPAAGHVHLHRNGEAVEDAEARGKHVAFLTHQDAVKLQLTAWENLRFFAELYAARDDLDAVLARVGLSRQRDLPGRDLSAGQKRRLSLARMLIAHRPVWLLDEPLAALDRAGKALAAALIAEHCAQGGIAMAATHDPLDGASARLVLT